ncbi:MAG: hypothetical protein Q9180_008735, partial [Flavoplaca navasiana]
DQKPMANPFDGPITQRPHPPRCHPDNGNPFYVPSSAPDDRKRCRWEKIAAPFPSPWPSSGRRLVPSTSHNNVETEPEAPTASGNRRDLHALHANCKTESVASSSTTSTVGPGLTKLICDRPPSMTDDAKAQPSPRLQALEKASSVACSNPQDEELDRPYRFGGRGVEGGTRIPPKAPFDVSFYNSKQKWISRSKDAQTHFSATSPKAPFDISFYNSKQGRISRSKDAQTHFSATSPKAPFDVSFYNGKQGWISQSKDARTRFSATSPTRQHQGRQ